MTDNGELIGDIVREQEADAYLSALRGEAAAAKRQIDGAGGPTSSRDPASKGAYSRAPVRGP